MSEPLRVRANRVVMLPPRVVARHLSMSVDFVYDEIRAEHLRAIKIGREWRIVSTDAARYLASLGAPIPDEW